MPHIIIFRDTDFRGPHTHIFGRVADLNRIGFNDSVSSFCIIEGNWEFFRHKNFDTKVGSTLGPRAVSNVTQVDIDNDDLSSLRPV